MPMLASFILIIQFWNHVPGKADLAYPFDSAHNPSTPPIVIQGFSTRETCEATARRVQESGWGSWSLFIWQCLEVK